MSIIQKLLIIFTVKNSDQIVCKAPHHQNRHRFQHCTGNQTPAKQAFYMVTLSFSVAFADKRLCTLRQSVKNRHCHKGKISHYSVGCHAYISCDPKKKHVKNDRNDR